MSDQKFPPGWDEARIREVIEHYDSQDEDERAAEIDAAWEAEGMTLMSVPTELVPEIRAPARPQADRLERLTVELQTGGCLLTFSLEGAGGTRGTRLRVAGSGRYGRMRGLHLPARLGVPHPPLRGTFSRGEKV